ncbi:MAG: spore coat U domain-containing protein [Alphaproteobacteria bacterium]|nr:spore coat U domain-containing protein [Alphaproteobacteria bacterium]MBV9150928.1 spore coat U domain-containing protein [Alphaproteobacteria bacterium]MBV9584292.1 spore coat U domain-containing protein [Alphaproteobacteria bacterium]MBV9964401.1 spore coat U domain-containing protein [Alphaproteobacteria bacterium]
MPCKIKWTSLRAFLALLVFSAGLLASSSGFAGTTTTTLSVTLTINAGCTVSSSPVAFPAQSVLASAVSQTGSLTVTCTNTTPYNVGLDKGSGTGATITNRLMTGPSSATVTYGLFQDSGHSTNWGNTVGTDTVAGTGNGSAQTLTVYGHIAPQTTPQPGAYADTVNVTVTF